MLRFVWLLLAVCFASPGWAALSANTVWEVRTTGSSTNSGAYSLSAGTLDATLAATNGNTASPTVTSVNYTFVAGDVGAVLHVASGTNWIPGDYPIASVAAGAATLSKAVATVSSPTSGSWSIDYTQQASSQFSGTDLATNGAGTGVTSATHTFTQADVNNSINISAGAGFTTGRYQILSVSGGTATIDRSAGLSLTNGTWTEGGALDNVSTLAGAMVGSNKAWIQKGTYSISATSTFTAASVTPSNTVAWSEIIGYNTARGDISPGVNAANRPLIQITTANNILAFNNTGWMIRNIILGGSGATPGRAITFSAALGRAINCKVTSFSTTGVTGGGSDTIVAYSEFTGGTSGDAINITARAIAFNNWIHDNASNGINMAGEGIALFNTISNNSGSHQGIVMSGGSMAFRNTIYNSGSHGILLNTTALTNFYVTGNILANNGGYGLAATNSAYPARWEWDGNAYYTNTSGNRNNLDDTGSAIAIDLSGPYSNTLDVTLSATPFNNAASNDFTLNNTAGGGAAARAFGVPNAFPGLSQASYNDMGAFQHQDAGGSAGMLYRPMWGVR